MKKNFTLEIFLTTFFVLFLLLTTKASNAAISRNLTIGSRGEDVKEIQQKLGVTPTGYFGTQTRAAVMDWQRDNSLPSTGFFGSMSRVLWSSLTNTEMVNNLDVLSSGSSISRNLTIGSRGEDVKEIQQRLGVTPTGYFGTQTRAAVMNWQRDNSLPSTGFFGSMSRNLWNSSKDNQSIIQKIEQQMLPIVPVISNDFRIFNKKIFQEGSQISSTGYIYIYDIQPVAIYGNSQIVVREKDDITLSPLSLSLNENSKKVLTDLYNTHISSNSNKSWYAVDFEGVLKSTTAYTNNSNFKLFYVDNATVSQRVESPNLEEVGAMSSRIVWFVRLESSDFVPLTFSRETDFYIIQGSSLASNPSYINWFNNWSKKSRFEGWYTDENLTQKYDVNTPVYSNLILYAKISDLTTHSEGVNVKFMNFDSTSAKFFYEFDFTIPAGLSLTSKSGFWDWHNYWMSKVGDRFEGWYTDENLTQKYDVNIPINSDLTLYAKFQDLR